MRLDEIEAKAKAMLDYFNESRVAEVNINTARDLAVFVTLLAPVARRALAIVPDDIEDGPDWDDEDWLKFGDVVDTLRAALEQL